MQYSWGTSEVPVPLNLEVQYNYIPVSGIIPTVEIYRLYDNYYLDWGTNTFVASGGTKQGSMSGITDITGFYAQSFNPIAASQTGDYQKYYIKYHAIIPSGFDSNNSDVNIYGTETYRFYNDVIAVSGAMTASFVE